MSFFWFFLCFFVLVLRRFIWFCKSGVAKHIKKEHCLGNSYVEKSMIFGCLGIHWTSCIYFNNCVLGDFIWVWWKKCTPHTPEPLFLATALKPNTFKMMIYELFWLVGVCFLGDSYDSVNPVWRNIFKKNIASAIHMSKNQPFLVFWT